MITIALGLLIPLLGTVLGSAFVFLMKDEMPKRVQKSLLGFASDHSNLSTIGFAIGFVLMMVLVEKHRAKVNLHADDKHHHQHGGSKSTLSRASIEVMSVSSY